MCKNKNKSFTYTDSPEFRKALAEIANHVYETEHPVIMGTENRKPVAIMSLSSMCDMLSIVLEPDLIQRIIDQSSGDEIHG